MVLKKDKNEVKVRKYYSSERSRKKTIKKEFKLSKKEKEWILKKDDVPKFEVAREVKKHHFNKKIIYWFLIIVVSIVVFYFLFKIIRMWIVPIIAFLILLGVLYHHFYLVPHKLSKNG